MALDAGSVVGWTIDAPYKQVPRSKPVSLARGIDH